MDQRRIVVEAVRVSVQEDSQLLTDVGAPTTTLPPCYNAVAYILFGCYIITSILAIIMGEVFSNDCPASSLIPKWLLVVGIPLLVGNLVNKASHFVDNKESAGFHCLNWICGFFFAAAMVVYCIGVVILIFNSGDLQYNPKEKNYCHPTIYRFSIWIYAIWPTLLLLKLLSLGMTNFCYILRGSVINWAAACCRW